MNESLTRLSAGSFFLSSCLRAAKSTRSKNSHCALSFGNSALAIDALVMTIHTSKSDRSAVAMLLDLGYDRAAQASAIADRDRLPFRVQRIYDTGGTLAGLPTNDEDEARIRRLVVNKPARLRTFARSR